MANVAITTKSDLRYCTQQPRFKNCDGSNFNLTVYDNSFVTGVNHQIIWGDGTPDYTSGTAPTGGFSHVYTTSDIFDLDYIISYLDNIVTVSDAYKAFLQNASVGIGGTTNYFQYPTLEKKIGNVTIGSSTFVFECYSYCASINLLLTKPKRILEFSQQLALMHFSERFQLVACKAICCWSFHRVCLIVYRQ